MTFERGLSVGVLVFLLGGEALVAQPNCVLPPYDDGYAIGCCQLPTPFVPTPTTGVTMNAEWGVYTNCALTNQTTASVQIGAPVTVLCDMVIIPMTINLPSLLPAPGALLGKYSRTWSELDALGFPRQVWRYLVNGDFYMMPGGGCPAGPCTPPSTGAPWFKKAYFVGHVDYACDSSVSGTGNFKIAFSLHHLPGCIQHAAFSSCSIPALATSNSTYHLVGPSPFTFAPFTPPSGNPTGDSARTSFVTAIPFLYRCHGEMQVNSATMTTAGSTCPCTTASSGPWHDQTLTGSVCCNGISTLFTTVPVPGTPLQNTGLIAHTVGQWTGLPGDWPGARSLTAYVGVLLFSNGNCPPANPIHIMAGVGTQTPGLGQPFPAFNDPGCPPSTPTPGNIWIDLGNMLPLVNWPATLPGIGSLYYSDLVINFTM